MFLLVRCLLVFLCAQLFVLWFGYIVVWCVVWDVFWFVVWCVVWFVAWLIIESVISCLFGCLFVVWLSGWSGWLVVVGWLG